MPQIAKIKFKNTLGLKKIFPFLVLVIAVFSFALSFVQTKAQLASDGFQVTAVTDRNIPWFIENVQQGSKIFREIEISNLSEEKRDFDIYAGDSFQLENGSLNFNQKDQPNSGPASWINVREKQVSLNSKQSLRAGFEINVPGDAKAGQYMAVVAAEPVKPKDQQGFELSTRIGVRVYFNVGSDIINQQSLEILSTEIVTAGSPELETYLQTIKANPTKPHLLIKTRNTSNTFVQADLSIETKYAKKREAQTPEENDGQTVDKTVTTTYAYEFHPDKDEINLLVPLDIELDEGTFTVNTSYKYSELLDFVLNRQNVNEVEFKFTNKVLTKELSIEEVDELQLQTAGYIKNLGTAEQAAFNQFVVSDGSSDLQENQGFSWLPVQYIASIISFTCLIILLVYFGSEKVFKYIEGKVK